MRDFVDHVLFSSRLVIEAVDPLVRVEGDGNIGDVGVNVVVKVAAFQDGEEGAVIEIVDLRDILMILEVRRVKLLSGGL